MSKAGERILRSARQPLAFARGEVDAKDFRVHVPDDIDVWAIRRTTGMTQETFARHFGVSKLTVQDWEQGRRVPTGAARAFLTHREPAAVLRRLVAAPQPAEPVTRRGGRIADTFTAKPPNARHGACARSLTASVSGPLERLGFH